MASISASGPISFSQIQAVFGGSDPISLSEYYSDAPPPNYTSGVSGIPARNTPISITMFQGKSKTLLTTLAPNVYSYAQTVKHIDDIPYTTFNSITTNVFYLNYNLSVNTGTTTVRVACRKSPTKQKITQSCFTLNGQAMSFNNSDAILNVFVNDDMDTLFMDGTGNGYISTLNNESLSTGTYYILTGTSSLLTINTTPTWPQGYSSTNTAFANATVVAFPHVSKTLYFNKSSYMISGYGTYTWPSVISSYIVSDTFDDNLTTVSDGVNSVLIIWGNANNGYYTTFDLTNGQLYASTSVTFNDYFNWTNTTEQDAIGNQLFSVDGAICYYKNLRVYYSSSDASGYSFLDNVNTTYTSVPIGTLDTQTGMDLATAIDTTDGYLYFADWGHDDGGLFNYGNDNSLGYTKTNIFKIPPTFTGTSPDVISLYSTLKAFSYIAIPGSPRTLLNYLQSFGVTGTSVNTNTGLWNTSYSGNIFYQESPITTVNYFTRYNRVRIIDGDGSTDGLDWVVFNFGIANGSEDFDGNNATQAYFGGENTYNGGTGGLSVNKGHIWGFGTLGWKLLYQLPLPGNGSFNHTNGNWFTSGGTVTNGDGKYSNFDTLLITFLGFSVS